MMLTAGVGDEFQEIPLKIDTKKPIQSRFVANNADLLRCRPQDS
jgi:hypothetical protein